IRDVAEDIPKPMIPVGGRPILWHIMKGYARHGFTDFVLCLGYKSWVIKRYFLDYHLSGGTFTVKLGWPSRLELHGTEAEEVGRITRTATGLHAWPGCSVKRVERFITAACFHLTYGDGLSDVNLRELVAFHRPPGRTGTVTAVQPPSRFGEIEVDGGRVVEFNEKPVQTQSWINGGFFVFNRGFLDRLEDDPGPVPEPPPAGQLGPRGRPPAFPPDG